MKRSLIVVAAAFAAAAFAGQAVAGSTVKVTIQHEKVGCHSWAIGNGAYKATQSLTVKAGTALEFIDNDVMPHQIVEVAGRKLALHGTHLTKIGAHVTIVLAKPGTYVFVTVGEDHALRLIVTVK
jgi:plastocyanin